MPIEKRRQLCRCYYELVSYVPWVEHPDKTFLNDDVRRDLEENDVETGMRYSLKRYLNHVTFDNILNVIMSIRTFIDVKYVLVNYEKF
jgi:hypothetical protein